MPHTNVPIVILSLVTTHPALPRPALDFSLVLPLLAVNLVQFQAKATSSFLFGSPQAAPVLSL